jgi:hypothetical protein
MWHPFNALMCILGQEQNQNICQKNQSAVQIQFILKVKLNPNRSERWNKTNKHQLLGYWAFLLDNPTYSARGILTQIFMLL